MVFLWSVSACSSMQQLLSATALCSIIVLLTVYAPTHTQAVPVASGNGANVEFKRYCSNNLAEAIRVICGGRYNSLARKFPDSVGRPMPLRRFANDEGGVFHRPLHNGPIHECCRRPCGYSELKMYCAPD